MYVRSSGRGRRSTPPPASPAPVPAVLQPARGGARSGLDERGTRISPALPRFCTTTCGYKLVIPRFLYLPKVARFLKLPINGPQWTREQYLIDQWVGSVPTIVSADIPPKRKPTAAM